MHIFRLKHRSAEDFPAIDWSLHAPMAHLWLYIDGRHKLGLPVDDLLDQVAYRLQEDLFRPTIDCFSLVPGLAVSERARGALEALDVPDMRFLGFRVNDEPFFLFYTDRCIDCLDRRRSDIVYFRSSPERVKQVTRFAFVEERIRPFDVFTLPELSDKMFFWSQQTFVTDQARSALVSAGLVGLRFEPVTRPERRETTDPETQ